MKNTVLDWLIDNDDYVSGQVISRRLGVTRAAVWKIVKTLQDEGYPIKAVPRRGYKIDGSADVLTARQLRGSLARNNLENLVGQVFYEDSVDSTNLMAKRAAEKIRGNAIFVASKQEKGRGRRGKEWSSDSTEGLWFSLLLRPGLQISELAPITLYAGLAAARALAELGLEAGLKWPNDIIALSNRKKLGGILTEMLIEDNSVSAVIIGIGINVSSREFPAWLEDIATSLYLAGDARPDRLELLEEILKQFFTGWADFSGTGSWLDEYRKFSLTLDNPVKVLVNGQESLRGRAVDINDRGELVVADSEGLRHVVCSGEVSVRGLLGDS